jgi:MFS family permease
MTQIASRAVISDIWDAGTRGKAMALFTLAPFAGPAIGPTVAGFVGESMSWRWVFWILAIFVSRMSAAWKLRHSLISDLSRRSCAGFLSYAQCQKLTGGFEVIKFHLRLSLRFSQSSAGPSCWSGKQNAYVEKRETRVTMLLWRGGTSQSQKG